MQLNFDREDYLAINPNLTEAQLEMLAELETRYLQETPGYPPLDEAGFENYYQLLFGTLKKAEQIELDPKDNFLDYQINRIELADGTLFYLEEMTPIILAKGPHSWIDEALARPKQG